MDIAANISHDKELDNHLALEAQDKTSSFIPMEQCKNCIAYHEYPEGECCTVQAEQYGKPYLIKDMEKCPGLPKPL
jgi:hypothetical protein